jgi:hypothetical protein
MRWSHEFCQIIQKAAALDLDLDLCGTFEMGNMSNYKTHVAFGDRIEIQARSGNPWIAPQDLVWCSSDR